MRYFAVCKLKNGEFECIRIQRANVSMKYKDIVNRFIEELKGENEIRTEDYKIIKFVEVVEHGNGFSPHFHSVWCKARCEEAKFNEFPVYDFEHPENGIKY